MAYNLADIRTRVRTKIKDRNYSGDTIDQFINDAIIEIADLYLWRYFQKKSEDSLGVGETAVKYPKDHQVTRRLILVDSSDPKRYWNLKDFYLEEDVFFGRFPTPEVYDNSQPTYWTVYGDYIYFNCPANINYTLHHYYQRVPADLSNDNDVPSLPVNFREAIVLGASYRVEQERDNYDIGGVLQGIFDDRVGDLVTRLTNNTLAGPDTIILPARRG